MEKLTFKVNEYEGPLDLILALLSKHQIGIYDINISDLLEQYMAYIKTKRAMDLYEDLLTLREPPMRILFLIARQFNQLLLVRELQASGADRGTVASKLKVPPFVAGKLSSQAAAFTKEQLISYVQTCVDAEEAVKTGRMGDRLAVELLISQPRSSVR